MIEGTSPKGTAFIIRTPRTEDAESVWKYINRLSKERTFIRFQGEELTLDEERAFVEKCIEQIGNKTGVTLFLVVGDEIQGISEVALNTKTEQHVGVLGLSIDQSVRGEGLGEALMRATLDEAVKILPGLRTVTLKVLAPNLVARSLYEKLGFKIYGVLPNGALYRDALVDEMLLYKEVR